jgi:hypothetical protein
MFSSSLPLRVFEQVFSNARHKIVAWIFAAMELKEE